MDKSYTFTEEEIKQRCHLALLLVALEMARYSSEKKENKPDEQKTDRMEKLAESIVHLFIC